MPSCTTKRKTTNLKTNNNENCQKIKLYGSLTTKELKKKHSSRPVGGAEMGSWAEKTCSKAAAGRLGWARQQFTDWARWQLAEQAVPHLRADKPRGTTGEQDILCNLGFQCWEIKSQNL